jgi:UDP-glucuronate 4-epimerase
MLIAGVLGLDNFNDYYPVALKRARQAFAASNGVYIVDGDITDAPLLERLFNVCEFSHVLHLAAQVGVAGAFPYFRSFHRRTN